ncbi:hypothetical protein BS78_06G157500 [Paspalum vaginatum]|nr:hypothetical protein BS78_06G157500 [Paspalum vaginatum]
MADDEWRYATYIRDRDADDSCRAGLGRYSGERVKTPRLPITVVMVLIPPVPTIAVHHKSTDAAAVQTTPSPPEPGSLASNMVVAKMMKRMNYREGTGLGGHGQGIVAPIEVPLRPKNAGLGTVEGSIGRAADEPPPSAENWPKWGEAGGAKKRKRDRESGEIKILAIRPLVEESAAEAVARVQKALARAARWSSSSSGLGDPCYRDEMAAITKAMKWVQEESASGTLTTGELIRQFTALKEKCPREYATYRLADAARAIVAPLLRSVFQQWEPLEDPSRGLESVSMLKDVLLDDGSAASPYAALVDDAVVGAALASAAETWEARDPGPMIRFLETWGDALPLLAIQRLLEQGVMPKLSAAVESWEPRWEAEPCHVWVHPWILLLGRWLEPLYVTVRRKLGKALLGWHAARATADFDMVLPWKDAFGPAAWEDFVDRHVVPYLRQGLRALRVTPPKQEDDGFGGVMRWAPVVSARDMAQLLQEEFFGKWHDALCRWLWDARPKAGEAIAWHQGWKRLLTPELLADERVRVPIEAGLQTISRAAQGLEVYRPGQGQHAGEAHSWRSRSRRRAVVGCGNKRRY